MCKYCEDNLNDRDYLVNDLFMYICGNGELTIGDDYSVKLNYCPICGRELRKATKSKFKTYRVDP